MEAVPVRVPFPKVQDPQFQGSIYATQGLLEAPYFGTTAKKTDGRGDAGGDDGESAVAKDFEDAFEDEGEMTQTGKERARRLAEALAKGQVGWDSRRWS